MTSGIRPITTTAIVAAANVVVFLAAFVSAQEASSPASRESGKRYDIAAFVWPAYHPDDRARVFWPMGMGEWETVLKNEPKFKGHEQPRYPLWGYINEADPRVAEMEINAAADHGVNVFIFDWYWYDDMFFLEGHLNDGFLKARNIDRMKFYLMWANCDINLALDKRNADEAFARKNEAVIWKGAVDRSQFEKIARRWIEKYFCHPCYYQIDGKPVLMMYDLNAFINGLGGVRQAKEALDWFRAAVKTAGFKGVDLQLTLRRDSGRRISVVPGDQIGTPKEIVEQLRFDSISHYQFCHFVDVDRDYREIIPEAAKAWNEVSQNYQAKYYPHVSVGWDTSPRAFHVQGVIVKNNTPQNFEKALREAKAFVDAHPGQAPLITVNSWNEWTETSYLMPCTIYGYGYLQAVKRVFVEEQVPADVLMKTPDLLVGSSRCKHQ